MAKLLPITLMLLGGAVGAGAGIFLKPAEPVCETPEGCEEKKEIAEPAAEDEQEDVSYIAMQNQFVVPVIRSERVQALVVLSLSLETLPDKAEAIFSREPKIRDVFLQVLFDHAHIGGFDGTFTESGRLSVLKVALLEAARSVVGTIVSDVIITDIVRQEM